MCGLKRYTDGECGHTGQHSAASEQSSLTRGVGSNMASKNGSNVAARFLPKSIVWYWYVGNCAEIAEPERPNIFHSLHSALPARLAILSGG